jgi:hypothetical protein
LFNAHLETIYPALIRRVNLPDYYRERIQTPDNDFLDLDWLLQPSRKLVIISHGLEGNSSRAYIKGMARALFSQGFDVLAWNYRGCSGEINRQLRFYHSGATDDLNTVLDHVLKSNQYDEINLIGFSLGGNLTLKYLGEQRIRSPLLKRAVAFSTPLDLYTSCQEISKPSNWIYSKRFLVSLRKKVIEKSNVIQGLDIRDLSKVKTLMEFDDYFTGPVHGFKNARDYYDKCSSLQFLRYIQLPVLIVNAWNDPFLSKACYPVDELKNHPTIHFETPDYGGHVGFTQFNKNGLYWSEQRALQFLTEHD